MIHQGTAPDSYVSDILFYKYKSVETVTMCYVCSEDSTHVRLHQIGIILFHDSLWRGEYTTQSSQPIDATIAPTIFSSIYGVNTL